MTGIELYQSGDGAEALRRCPVRWDGNDLVFCGYEERWCWGEGAGRFSLSPGEALAVIERAHRIALAGKGVWLELGRGYWYVCRASGLWLTRDGRWSSGNEVGKWADYAAAQIPAILATFGKAVTQ